MSTEPNPSNEGHDPFSAALAQAARQVADGTHQSERASSALQAGYFLVVETTLHQRIHMAAQFARQVQRFDSRNEPAGHWGGLFSGDEALLLASIVNADEMGAMDSLAHAAPLDPQTSPLPEVMRHIVLRALLVDRWLGKLRAVHGDGAQRVAQLISELISSRLAGALQRALQVAAPAAAGLRTVLDTLSPAWSPKQAGALAALADEAAVRDQLRSALALMDYATARVRDTAQEQFVLSQGSGQHAPAAALMMATAALQGRVQDQLNGFTERLINFYQDEVLHLKPAQAVADSVHLVALCQPNLTGPVVVPKGTRFVATAGAAEPLHFSADHTTVLNDARVAALCTLRLERDRYISPEVELGYINRAWVQQLPLPGDQADSERSAAAATQHWPLFGGSQEQQNSGGEDACIGLAFAAPELLLGEGEREVRITLRLAQAAWVDPKLMALADMLARRLALPAAPVSPASAAEPAKPAKPATTPLEALTQLFQAYIDNERSATLLASQPGFVSAARLAEPALARLSAQGCTPLSCFRAYLVVRAQLSRGDAFKAAAGQLFAHWLLSGEDPLASATATSSLAANISHDTDLWLSADDRVQVKLAAQESLQRRARTTTNATLTAVDTADETHNKAGSGAPTQPNSGDPLSLFIGDAVPDRKLLFSRLFTGLFDVSCTSPTGWHAISESYVLRLAESSSQDTAPSAGLVVVARLSASQPAVVPCNPALHGSTWDTHLPLLRLRLRAFGGVYAYSLLESALLLQAQLAVEVSGLRQLSLHNALGQLDASKPFSMLGPLPVTGSYLVVGAAELACKRLTELGLRLQWGGLPNSAGGFATHYSAYASSSEASAAASVGINNHSFRVNLTVLRDGAWEPPAATSTSVTLFAADGAQGELLARNTLRFDPMVLRNYFRASRATRGNQLGSMPPFDTRSNNGFVRVQLIEPGMAFGHADYPNLLSQAMTARLRRKVNTALPKAPYTPLLEGMSVDYQAECVIQPGSAANPVSGDPQEAAHAPRVYHLLPFGAVCMHPRASAAAMHLLPPIAHEGNLYIGLTAKQLRGRLSLLFHLHAEAATPRNLAHERSAAEPSHEPNTVPSTQWSYLVGDQWRALSAEQVMSDSTSGFLSSGLVQLDIPGDIDTQHQVMPAGLYWLSVAVDTGFAGFAALHGVLAQGLRATRVRDDAKTNEGSTSAGPTSAAPRGTRGAAGVWQALPAHSVGLPAEHLPGLAGVLQIGASFGGRSAPTRHALRVRSGERLRHKQRASLPWDFERLVLERFPDVAKVKCFSANDFPNSPQLLAPGQVLLAVLPTAARFDRVAGRLYPHLTAIELRHMEDFLRQHASAHASIVVRNASYERIQVRCALGLAEGVAVGDTLAQADRALFDFISPWVDGGFAPRFGWVLRQEDVEARLRQVPGVEFVTGLSMLHIARHDSGYFALRDTAAGQRQGQPEMVRNTARNTAQVQRIEVRPLAPWSLAVPMANHSLAAIGRRVPQSPQKSGIKSLAIGSNFIIGEHHG